MAQCKSYSNDASLLFPTNAWTMSYTGLSWPSNGNRAGFLAITAQEDDTDVDLTGSGLFKAGGGIDAMGSGTVKLNAGDVLEAVADYGGDDNTFGADISGTRIRASHAVQVIGGHSCARVPTAATGYCDHLEQSMFPAETLGNDYLVTYPAAPGSTSPHVIRIEAVEDATVVKFDPAPRPGHDPWPRRSSVRAHQRDQRCTRHGRPAHLDRAVHGGIHGGRQPFRRPIDVARDPDGAVPQGLPFLRVLHLRHQLRQCHRARFRDCHFGRPAHRQHRVLAHRGNGLRGRAPRASGHGHSFRSRARARSASSSTVTDKTRATCIPGDWI